MLLSERGSIVKNGFAATQHAAIRFVSTAGNRGPFLTKAHQ
jgi:hypothetical protein